MEIEYFKEFTILAKTRNFWAASEELFINQSTLSKHIKSMEKELGAPLFSRTSRRVELTEFGEMMLPYARTIVNAQYDYESAALRYLSSSNVTLTVGTIPVIPRYNITEILLQYQIDFPGVELETIEEDSFELKEDLANHKCDLILFRDSEQYVSHVPEQEAMIVRFPFAADRMVAVLPVNHPLAERESLTLSELADEDFALIKTGTLPYNMCVSACREAGFKPHVLFTSHHLEAIFDMVTKGKCVSLLFENHVAKPFKSLETLEERKMLPRPYAVIPVEPMITSNVYLGYLRTEPLSNAAQHFVEYLRRALAEANM